MPAAEWIVTGRGQGHGVTVKDKYYAPGKVVTGLSKEDAAWMHEGGWIATKAEIAAAETAEATVESAPEEEG